MPTMMQVTIPPGTQPGQTMEIQDHLGKRFQITVPPGAVPGTVINFQVASDREQTDAEIRSLLSAAGKGAVAVTILTGKALFGAMNYAHAKGWDGKAARAIGVGVRAVGGAVATEIHRAVNPNQVINIVQNQQPQYGPPPTNPMHTPELQQFYVVVPAGSMPGSSIIVQTPSGQQAMVTVPEGANPGTQFMCKI